MGKDVPDGRCLFTEYVGVNPQRHGRVGLAKPGGHDMHGNSSKKQGSRVQMTQIMQTGVRQRFGRGREQLVVLAD